MVIGRLLEAKEDDNGLYVKIELFNDPQIPEASRAYSLLKLGEIDSFSIGYKVVDADFIELEDGKGITLIKELILYEVSLVTFPMNEKAEVLVVKKEKFEMENEILELLREIKNQLDSKEEPTVETEVKTEEAPSEPAPEMEVKSEETPESPVEEEKGSCGPMDSEDEEEKKKKKPCKKEMCPSCGCELTVELEPAEEDSPEEEETEGSKSENVELTQAVENTLDLKKVEELIESAKAQVVSELLAKFDEFKNEMSVKSEIVEEKEPNLEDFISSLLNTDIIL